MREIKCDKISHPPEAIEEIEVPVYKKYYTYDKSRKTIDVDEGKVNEVIKLHRCKLCGMVIIPKEKAHED